MSVYDKVLLQKKSVLHVYNEIFVVKRFCHFVVMIFILMSFVFIMMRGGKMSENNRRLKSKLSVVDWALIYVGTILGVNILVATQVYPSHWFASFLPGGTNDVNLLLVHEILQAILMIGGVLLCLHLRGKSVQEIGWQVAKTEWTYFAAIAFGVLTCTITLFVSSIFVQLFPQWATTQNVVSTTLQVNTQWGFLASFLSVGILAPLCEELLFRGYLYHAVRECCGIKMSVCITAFLFAAVHGQWFQLVPLFMAGCFLNCFYLRTESLIATVLMHSAWNTFSLFLVVFFNVTV